MADIQASSAQKIAFLQEQYCKLLPERTRELSALWHVARERHALEKYEELYRRSHALAGSAGTFGAPDVSSQAHDLEMALRVIIDENRYCSEVEEKFIAQVLENLHGLALATSEKQTEQQELSHPPRTSDTVRIALFVSQEEQGDVLQDVLRDHGYHVARYHDANGLAHGYESQQADLILVDPEFSAAGEPVSAVLEQLNAANVNLPPLAVVSNRGDIRARLAAARYGAVRFFDLSLIEGEMLKTLKEVVYPHVDSSFRVLIIDDDDNLLEYYSALIAQAGMSARTLSNPLSILDTINEYKPELILLDVYMEQCSGLELAMVIRQDDRNAGIPIVFLSTEARIEKQLVAMNLGGDDFLTKPILPRHLLQTITSRLRRARLVNSLSERLRSARNESDSMRQAMGEHDLVSITDNQGVIIYANDMFTQVSGYSRDELLGQNHRIINSGSHPIEFFTDMWTTISSGNIWKGVFCNRAKDGSHYWVNSTIVPFLDAHGLPYQYVAVRTDITPLKETEARLRGRERRLRLSHDFAGVGTWELDISCDSLRLSPQVSMLFGLEFEEKELSFDVFLDQIYPDDREHVASSIKACLGEKKSYDIIHRYVWPDGSVRWMEEKGDIELDSSGQPVCMLGMVQDVTERKKLEESLAEQKMLLALLHNAMARFMVTSDLNEVSHFLLEGLLEITKSEFGMLVRMGDESTAFVDETNSLFLDVSESAHISSQEQTLRISVLKSMVEETCRSGQWTFASGARDIEMLPLGTVGEYLYSLVCVPVYYANKLVAVYALANRPHGYGRGYERILNMFNVSYGVIVQARYGMDRESVIREQLVAAKDVAENANKAKTQFLSSMSHELRTPMNAILGFSQLLEMDDDTNLTADQQESVAEIIRAGKHLLELINEVLDLSRIEAGRISLNMEDVSLEQVVDESMALMGTLAQRYNVEFQYNLLDCSGIFVRADYIRLKQVLLNLVSNGIKYNKPNGQVELVVGTAYGKVTVEVKDTGKGIPEELFKDLFKPFERLGAESTSIEGTGIGLLITRQLVELMGGCLEVESRVGVGSCFRVVLQVSEEQPQSISTQSVQAEQNTIRQKPRVLFVEDNPVNVKLVQQCFSVKQEIELYSAHTAQLGLEFISQQAPDLILLDIDMPGMNGFELLAEIRSRTETRNVPVIALSANAMRRDVDKGRAAGFNEYIVKPVDLSYLQNVVESFILK